MDVNKAIIIGNVGADPEIRNFQDGGRVANLSVATNRSWKDKNTGERKTKTEWHRVVVRAPGLVDIVEKFVRKGSKLYLEGSIETRKWQDKEGNDRYSTEINLLPFSGVISLLDSKGDRDDDGPGYTESAAPADIDDDVPF